MGDSVVYRKVGVDFQTNQSWEGMYKVIQNREDLFGLNRIQRVDFLKGEPVYQKYIIDHAGDEDIVLWTGRISLVR